MLENKKKRREKRRTSDMKAREAKKAALEIAGAIADRWSALISAAQGRGGFFPRLSNLRPDETKPGNPCTRLSFSLSLFLLRHLVCNLSVLCSLFYLLSVSFLFHFHFFHLLPSVSLLPPPNPPPPPTPPPDAPTGSSELEVSGTRRETVAVGSLG